MDLKEVIIRPVITEKSMADTARGFYTFRVNKKATKLQIKEAIQKLFKVKVVFLRTMIMKGKTKLAGRLRKRIETSAFKKAIVKLDKNQKIEIFETTK